MEGFLAALAEAARSLETYCDSPTEAALNVGAPG